MFKLYLNSTEKIKYDGDYMKITEEQIDGHNYERVYLRGGVKVFPINEDGKMLVMKEFRIHEGSARWKFVSGWSDKKEMSFLDIAKAELAEEVALEADTWEELTTEALFMKKQTFNPNTRFFFCFDIKEMKNAPENPDRDTVEETKWISYAELWRMVETDPAMWDEDTLIALMLLRKYSR